MKNFHPSSNGAAAPGMPDKNAMPLTAIESQKSINTKEIQINGEKVK